ncbi:MAG: hypothetical protein WCQ87_03730 [Parabacteroides sp.]
MISVLSDRCLAFDRNEKDAHGVLQKVHVAIGFNELPDWVEKTDYFKAAKKDGIIHVASRNHDEEAVKIMEENKKLKERIRELEEKKEVAEGQKEIIETIKKKKKE